jgi:predicted dehydrogenase
MKNAPRKIGLGVIGCGKGAEILHLPALSRLKDFRVLGVVDTDVDRLRHIGDKFGIEHRFTDYRLLLERDDVDAIAVLTPTALHADMGIAALSMGKHVFIDKPLALNLSECDQLIRQAIESGRKSMIGFNFRWHRLLRQAYVIIQSGALGKIKTLRSAYIHWHPGNSAQVWHLKREKGGGVLFNDAVHHFDLWRFLLGSEVAEVFSQSIPSEHYEDETGVMTAKMTNDVIVSAVFSYGSSPNSEIEVYGSAGRLHLSMYRFDGLGFFSHSTYPGDLTERLRRTVNLLKGLPKTLPVMLQGGDFNLTFRRQWQHFADCILRDQSPESTFVDGRCAVEIALAAIESASSGKLVQTVAGNPSQKDIGCDIRPYSNSSL